mmetsp:Transcript_117084/g.331726  ORF Transcript_117084/g.331726 Transcript_117084/m.331726 type:complete len:238 (+) Transcript_117084:180-893(+)
MRSCPFLPWSRSFWRSALSAGAAPGTWAETSFVEAFKLASVLAASSSTSWMVVSDSSSPSWPTICSRRSMSVSDFPIFSPSAVVTSLPLISLSPVTATFLYFARSCCATLRRPLILERVWTAPGPLALLCLTPKIFLASRHATEASFSAAGAFCPASLSASRETSWRSSFEKTSTTSLNAATFSSACEVASTTSAMTEASLLSKVSFLNASSFLAVPSMRAATSLSCSETVAWSSLV